MKRVVLAVALLAACKSKAKDAPASDDQPVAKLVDAKPAAPALDAAPATAPSDCAQVGAKMRAMIRTKDGAPDPDPVFGGKVAAAVEAMFSTACAQDGWSAEAARCVVELADEGADPCFLKLGAYAMVALGARLQELPRPEPIPVTACDEAGRTVGFAWALRAAKAAPDGASAQNYTEMFQAVGAELEEVCTDLAWAEPARACLVNARLPEELDAVDACVATLTDDQRGKLEALHAIVEAELSKQAAAGKSTGGDDCAAVGIAMVQIWTLKAQKSMAKHTAAAQWDLDHLEDLRALVVAACAEDGWTPEVRSCLTALKLPDEASAFGDCIGKLPPEATEALGKRTAVLEAVREQAIGAGNP